MSLIVGSDEPTVNTETGSSTGRTGVHATSKRWASFTCLPAAESLPPGEPTEPRTMEGEAFRQRFSLEAVHVVRGPRREPGLRLPPGLVAGATILRRELAATRRPGALGGPWLGTIDPRHSSTEDEVGQLLRQWHGNPFRVSLLLACAHSRAHQDPRPDKPDDRSFDHLAAPDAATVARVPALRRIVRQLHRTGPAGSAEWDTFVYFEMLPAQVAHLREYLAEQRDNPRTTRLVEREIELWMVKQLDGSEPPPPTSGGLA